MKATNGIILALVAAVAVASPQLIGFQYAVYNEPAPEKKARGGEDAWFANDYVLSVADGVGGWNNQGIDPAKYSKKLEANVRHFFSRDELKYRRNPKALMQIAADNDKEIGSSTFVLVTIDPDTATLRSGLLGDSSYMILRRQSNGDYESVYRSKEQQHRFNFPFQCGTNGDPISSAIENSHPIQEEDIVIVGSDGLFDNVFDKEIVDIVNQNGGRAPQEIVEAVGAFAFKQSLRKDFKSPFAHGAIEAGYNFLGGKSDDITIVLGIVKQAIEA